MSTRIFGALRCGALLLILQVSALATLQAQTTFTVTDTSDPGDGTCDATCTLREAIDAANAAPGADTIEFNFPGAATRTITVASALSQITEAVFIDGASDPDLDQIVIDGSSLVGSENGLDVAASASGTMIDGIAIGNFGGAGIALHGGGNQITRSRIGTNGAGTAAAPNAIGIYIDAGSGNNIGTTSGGSGNTLSGNTGDGLWITGSASGTQIRYNYIGVDITGGVALGNGRNGIRIEGSANNQIGSANKANVISANGHEGIYITGAGATGNSIEGNTIGTDRNKTPLKLGNGDNGGGSPKYSGVRITGGAGGNTVGTSSGGNIIGDSRLHGILIDGAGSANIVRGNNIGTVDGSLAKHFGNYIDGIRVASSSTAIGGPNNGNGNIVAYSGDDGVVVTSGATGVSIQRNSIYDNAPEGLEGQPDHLGIDLGDDGVTANDAGDPDNGANNLQNFPVITSAIQGGTIAGTLNSSANTTFSLEFFANATCDGSGNGEGQYYLGTASVMTDGSGDASFSENFGALTNGYYVTATATNNFNTSEFSACAQVQGGADVVVTKSGPSTVGAGANFDYTITVTNNGPETATDVDITDDLPAAVTFVSATNGGSFSAGNVTWPTIATLNNAESVNYTVTVTAPLTGSFQNVASATATSPDPDATNNDGTDPTSQVNTTVTEQADLEVTKSGPAGVSAGGSFGYTITVVNHGPNDATGVVVTDVLPGTVTYVSSNPTGNESGGTVTWPAFPLANGASAEFTVTVTAPASGTLNNVASATATTADPDATNNDGSNAGAKVTTTVGELADVQVSKSGPASVDAGANVDYTITVTNNGPSSATDVVIADALPAGATFVSASNSGSESGGTVTWPAVTLTNGQSVQRTVTVTAPGTGPITDVASATATTTDPNANNNNGSNSGAKVTTTINPLADVEVTKTGPANVAAAAQFSYTVTLTNHGPSPATGVVATDVLPGAVTFVSASNSGTESSGTVTWPAVDLANGQSVQRTVTVTAPTSGTLDNVASATATTADPDAANNDGSNAGAKVTTTVTEPADIEVTKSGPASVNAGADFDYTLTVTNNGPNAATGVVLQDVLPPEVTYVSSQGGTNSGGTVTWPPMNLANGASQQYTVTVTAPASGTVTNTASATSTTPDLNPSNNDGSSGTARVQTTVESFAVSVSPTSRTVVRGETASYVVTVSPSGTNFGNAVDLTCAALPAGATCSFDPPSVTPGVNSAASTLTVSTTAGSVTPTGTTSFMVVSTSGSITQNTPVDLDITKDFALSISPASATVALGGSADFTLSVDDMGFFDESISFACSNLPAGASCTFSPSTLTPNGTDGTVTLSVNASGSSASVALSGDGGLPWWAWLALLLALPIALVRARGRSALGDSRIRRRWSLAAVAIILGYVTLMSACNGDSTGPPQDVTTTFTVTGTAGSVQHSATATITVQM